MFCINCGREIINMARFCNYCGRPVQNIAPLPYPSQPYPSQNKTQQGFTASEAPLPEQNNTAAVDRGEMPDNTLNDVSENASDILSENCNNTLNDVSGSSPDILSENCDNTLNEVSENTSDPISENLKTDLEKPDYGSSVSDHYISNEAPKTSSIPRQTAANGSLSAVYSAYPTPNSIPKSGSGRAFGTYSTPTNKPAEDLPQTHEKPERKYTLGHLLLCLASTAIMAITAGIFAGLYFSVV